MLLITCYRDEILYNAKLHPEQYSNTFSSNQIKQLHKSIRYVTQTAVDVLGDSSKFPEDWLFNHRWGKGKKPTTMPDGSKIVHVTVGGRTSAVVPSVQKKTGDVAADAKSDVLSGAEDEDEKETVKGKRGKAATNGKAKGAATKKNSAKKEVEPKEEDDDSEEEVKTENKKTGAKSARMASRKRKAATPIEEDEEEEKKKPVKRQNGTNPSAKKAKSTVKTENFDAGVQAPNGSRRRSGRV